MVYIVSYICIYVILIYVFYFCDVDLTLCSDIRLINNMQIKFKAAPWDDIDFRF